MTFACGARVSEDAYRDGPRGGSLPPLQRTGEHPDPAPLGTETMRPSGGSVAASALAARPDPSLDPMSVTPVASTSAAWSAPDPMTPKREALVKDLRSGPPELGAKLTARPADYEPPLPRLGTSGWRSSTEVFCDTASGEGRSALLWADSAGVAALTHVGPGRGGSDLRYNDGTGWRWLMGQETIDLNLLSGYPEGQRLLVGGPLAVDVNLDGSLGLSIERKPTWPAALQGIDASHAAVVFIGCGRACGGDVVAYRQTNAWVVSARVQGEAWSLWANDDSILLPNSFPVAPTLDPELRTLEVPEGGSWSLAIVGASPDNLWVFPDTNGPALHWESGAWTKSRNMQEAPVQAYSNGVQTFLITAHRFYRVEDDLTLVVQLDADGTVTFDSITGNPQGELFLALHDTKLDTHACNGETLVMFDGEEFHVF